MIKEALIDSTNLVVIHQKYIHIEFKANPISPVIFEES